RVGEVEVAFGTTHRAYIFEAGGWRVVALDGLKGADLPHVTELAHCASTGEIARRVLGREGVQRRTSRPTGPGPHGGLSGVNASPAAPAGELWRWARQPCLFPVYLTETWSDCTGPMAPAAAPRDTATCPRVLR